MALIPIDEVGFRTDWVAGVPLKMMSERYRMSRSSVSRRAREMGLSPRQSKPSRKRHNLSDSSPHVLRGRWVRHGLVSYYEEGT